jgi:uncharacterized membrane protein
MKVAKQTSPTAGGMSRAPALLFAIWALVAGTALTFLYPPMQVREEGDHFARAYQVSEGGLLPLKRRGETGGLLPSSLLQLLQAGKATSWHAESRIENPVEFYRDWLQIKLEPQSRAFYAFPATSAESPFPYLPQAAGIRLARLFSDSALATLYGARLGNLLVSVLCIIVAIYWTPVYKWVFACLALTPVVVSEMASATGYGLTYGVVFLFVAWVLRQTYGGVVTWGQTLVLLLLTAGMCLVIQGYFPLLLLYLLIPATRMGGRKRYWLMFAGMIVIAACTIGAWYVSRAPTFSPIKADVDPTAQARFVIQHPRGFIEALKLGLGEPPFLWTLSRTYSGFLTTNLYVPSVPLVIVCAVLLIAVCFLDGACGVGRVGVRGRLVPLGVGVAGMFSVLVFAYLYQMPVAARSIASEPWEYVPPGLVLLLCFFNLTPRPGGFAAFVRTHLGWFVAAYFLLRYAESLLGVVHRYYMLRA